MMTKGYTHILPYNKKLSSSPRNLEVNYSMAGEVFDPTLRFKIYIATSPGDCVTATAAILDH